MLTRIRKEASVLAFGALVDNITLLPKLEKKVKHAGHCLEYTAVSSETMPSILIACARDEHNRFRKAPLAKKVCGLNLSTEDEAACVEGRDVSKLK